MIILDEDQAPNSPVSERSPLTSPLKGTEVTSVTSQSSSSAPPPPPYMSPLPTYQATTHYHHNEPHSSHQHHEHHSPPPHHHHHHHRGRGGGGRGRGRWPRTSSSPDRRYDTTSPDGDSSGHADGRAFGRLLVAAAYAFLFVFLLRFILWTILTVSITPTWNNGHIGWYVYHTKTHHTDIAIPPIVLPPSWPTLIGPQPTKDRSLPLNYPPRPSKVSTSQNFAQMD